jgi:hypothetical protein
LQKSEAKLIKKNKIPKNTRGSAFAKSEANFFSKKKQNPKNIVQESEAKIF